MNSIAEHKFGFWIFFGFFALIWTIVATLTDQTFHFDIQEEIAWGKQWLIGLYRHPPMKVWLLEIANQLTDFAKPTPYALSTSLFALSQWAIYRAICDIKPHQFAFRAVALTTMIFLFSTHVTLWNANTAQFVFVGFLILSIWRALDTQRGYWWLLAAIAAAGGMLSKYSFATIAVSLFIWVLVVPNLRNRIVWPWFVAAALLFLILLLPNAMWVFNNFESTKGFATGRTKAEFDGLTGHLFAPLLVIAIAAGCALLPFLNLRFGTVSQTTETNGYQERNSILVHILGAASIGSLFMVILAVFATKTIVKDHWLMASLLPIVPFMVLVSNKHRSDIAWTAAASKSFIAVGLILLAAHPAERYYWLNLRNPERPNNQLIFMPSEQLKAEATTFWNAVRAENKNVPERPKIISGSHDAALLSNIYDGRPDWLERGSLALSPWVTAEKIEQSGIFFVGKVNNALINRFDLCVAKTYEFDWLNVRGQVAKIESFTAALPKSMCPD